MSSVSNSIDGKTRQVFPLCFNYYVGYVFRVDVFADKTIGLLANGLIANYEPTLNVVKKQLRELT